MSDSRWQLLSTPRESEEPIWELYHENSKTGAHDRRSGFHPSAFAHFPEALDYEQYPEILLPESSTPLDMALGSALAAGEPGTELAPGALAPETLAALLDAGYGVVTDDADDADPPVRARRTVASAGSAYPLEIYLHSGYVDGLELGLYHYHPVRRSLRRLKRGDQTYRIAEGLADPRVASGASLLLFVAAMFERSVLQFGNRGYRLALAEAGAATQNLKLAAAALGLAAIEITDFRDRSIDALLGFDGLSLSTVSLLALGAQTVTQPLPGSPKRSLGTRP